MNHPSFNSNFIESLNHIDYKYLYKQSQPMLQFKKHMVGARWICRRSTQEIPRFFGKAEPCWGKSKACFFCHLRRGRINLKKQLSHFKISIQHSAYFSSQGLDFSYNLKLPSRPFPQVINRFCEKDLTWIHRQLAKP